MNKPKTKQNTSVLRKRKLSEVPTKNNNNCCCGVEMMS